MRDTINTKQNQINIATFDVNEYEKYDMIRNEHKQDI